MIPKSLVICAWVRKSHSRRPEGLRRKPPTRESVLVAGDRALAPNRRYADRHSHCRSFEGDPVHAHRRSSLSRRNDKLKCERFAFALPMTWMSWLQGYGSDPEQTLEDRATGRAGLHPGGDARPRRGLLTRRTPLFVAAISSAQRDCGLARGRGAWPTTRGNRWHRPSPQSTRTGT